MTKEEFWQKCQPGEYRTVFWHMIPREENSEIIRTSGIVQEDDIRDEYDMITIRADDGGIYMNFVLTGVVDVL